MLTAGLMYYSKSKQVKTIKLAARVERSLIGTLGELGNGLQ